MVQFLSIYFFSWISSIFVGFFKSSRFFVSPCITQIDHNFVRNMPNINIPYLHYTYGVAQVLAL